MPLISNRESVRGSHAHANIIPYHQACEIFPVDEHDALKALA